MSEYNLDLAIEDAVIGAFSDGYDARGEGLRSRRDAEKRCDGLKQSVQSQLSQAKEEIEELLG